MSRTLRSSAIRFNLLAAGALLACVTAVAYLPSLRAGFVWDDDSFLTRNPLIRAPDGLWRFWFTTQPADYWPVTSTTLWFEWRLWGLHALGYHATNLALHVGESLLLWALLRRLAAPGAFLAALLFAVHPVNVESVAWIAERKNLMAMLFYLASIWFFLRAEFGIELTEAGRLPLRGGSRLASVVSWYWLSLTAFILALLSKGSVAMLPFVLLGVIVWRRRPDVRDAIRLGPFFLAAGVLVWVNVWFQSHHRSSPIHSSGPLERLLGAGAIVWFYLGKALLPLKLAFIYPEWHVRTAEWVWWLPILGLGGVTGILWFAARLRPAESRALPRVFWARPWLFAWAYFCLALAPVMGFADIYFMRYSPVADHYQHLAIIGVVTMAAAGWEKWNRSVRGPIPRLAAIAAVGGLACLTWNQCRNYRDAETLFRATLATNPGAWLAHNELGLIEEDAGRFAAAEAQFAAVLRLKPNNPETHNNLGRLFFETGRPANAIPQFEAALRLNPDSPAEHCNLAHLLAAIPGRMPDAVAHYEAALRIDPAFPDAEAHFYLGNACTREGRWPEAIAHYEAALRLQPGAAGVRHNLAEAMARWGAAGRRSALP